jgi:crotonobetainyl-CoA:carnitine CoA-transferase CaiB-like acyl-CoA transferase
VPIIVEPSTVWQNHKRFQLCRGSIFVLNGAPLYGTFLMGADTVHVCPHSHYQTKDGKWIAIACTSDQMFARLAEVMQQPELASAERYGPKELRLAARDDVNRIVAEWVASLDLETVLAHCSRGGVPASLIYSIADIFEDPQYRARGNIQMADSRAGEIAVPGVVPRLSETPVEIRWLGVGLGAQNEDVYKGLPELSSAELEDLRISGVI